MQNTFLDDNNRHHLLGELIEKSMLYEHVHIGGKVKLSTSMVIKYVNFSVNTPLEVPPGRLNFKT